MLSDCCTFPCEFESLISLILISLLFHREIGVIWFFLLFLPTTVHNHPYPQSLGVCDDHSYISPPRQDLSSDRLKLIYLYLEFNKDPYTGVQNVSRDFLLYTPTSSVTKSTVSESRLDSKK